jgi:hypothetical protein
VEQLYRQHDGGKDCRDSREEQKARAVKRGCAVKDFTKVQGP